MKTYKVKVTYTNGTTLISTVKAQGRESLKEQIWKGVTSFMQEMLEVKEIEILSSKIDKKLVKKFDNKLRDLGDYFESENDFLDKARQIFESEGFTMMNIPCGNNSAHVCIFNENEDVVENYKIYYVSTYLDSRKKLPYEIIKYNCLF